MPKNALVILGAGASRGLSVTQMNIPDDRYLPPITKEIFTVCKATNLHLPNYPGAELLASTLRNRLDADKESLESEMRKLQDSSNPDIARAFLEMPIFFQELFGEISARYSTSGGNYDHLVTTLLESDIDRIAFVTLNYDLFLDRALATFTRTPFRDMRSYITNDDHWMLIKLHGSVSWMRPVLRPVDGPGSTLEAKRLRLLALLDEIARFSDTAELRVAEWDDWFTRVDQGWQAHYPHLAVPVQGKPKPLCPQQHLDALREFLPTCKNVLAIGVSGRDLDLFEHMAWLPNESRLYMVGQPKDQADTASDNFIRGVLQLKDVGVGSHTFGGGFGDFLTDGGLDKFITEARD